MSCNISPIQYVDYQQIVSEYVNTSALLIQRSTLATLAYYT